MRGLKLAGLSGGDIRSYYGGAILGCKEGIFMVDEYTKPAFTGHMLVGKQWVPKKLPIKDLFFVYPKEGYISVGGNIHHISCSIRRTRRKGFTSESYTVTPLAGNVDRRSITDTAVLEAAFTEEKSTNYEKAVLALKRKDCRGYIFSKELCIHKRSNTREVYLRGQKLGNIKKEGLHLPKRLKVFTQELSEYNIPIHLV